MRLPTLLDQRRHDDALEVLACYYGLGRHRAHRFTGSWFDTWDSTGQRQADTDRFTADDLIAVSFLSVEVPPRAAVQLLSARAKDFSAALHAVGPDRDLVEEVAPWSDEWAGWTLWAKLLELPGVGATTASKLYSRKRPRLRPIYDSVVAEVTGSNTIWEPLRAELQRDRTLHTRLMDLRQEAALPQEVSALRVFDVLTWMEGKGNHPCRWP